MRRPDLAAYNGLTQWLETEIDRNARMNPGSVVLHRLNRSEYANAVRDLLDLEIDPVTLLPPDDSARGFDNVAGSLTISSTLLESYANAAGKVARRYSSLKTDPPTEPRNPEDKKLEKQIKPEAGLNRFLWDLRYAGASNVPDYYLFEYHDGSRGPFAVPGKYQVRLTVDGKSLAAPMELKLDPRLNVAQADLQKQFDLALQIRDQLSRVYDAVNQIQDVRSQIDGLTRRLPDAKPVVTAAADLDQKLLSVRDDLIQAKVKANEDSLAYPQRVDSKLASVALVVSDSTDSAPTEAAMREFEKLKKRADDALGRWAEIQRTDLVAFQKIMAGQNIQAIVVPAGGHNSAGGGAAEER